MTPIRAFSIRGIPVNISPFFLLLAGWLMYSSGVAEGLVLTVCFAFSILVHELGHALVAARLRLSPEILLHGVGGLCFHMPADSDRDDALIVLAGPLAGLFLGGLIFGASIGIQLAGLPVGRMGMIIIQTMLFINIGWSIVNLLPMWPLDGGQLFRLGMIQILPPLWAERVTHGVGVLLLVAATWLAFQTGFAIAGYMALYLLYQNVRVLLGETSGGMIRPRNRRAKGLLADVKAAYEAGDDEEVIRLGHVLRSESNLPASVVRGSFELIGVSTARLGRHEEALSYLRRAPLSSDVVEALIECLYQTDREDALDELLDSKAFKKLAPTRRREILEVVRPDRV